MLTLFAAIIGMGNIITSNSENSFAQRRCAAVTIDRPERADLDRLLVDDSRVCWDGVALTTTSAI